MCVRGGGATSRAIGGVAGAASSGGYLLGDDVFAMVRGLQKCCLEQLPFGIWQRG